MLVAKFSHLKTLSSSREIQQDEMVGYFQSITCRTKHINENVSIPYIYFMVGGQEFDLSKVVGPLTIRNTNTGAIRIITHTNCELKLDGLTVKAEDLIEMFYNEIL